jgi:hypothetical protein
VNQGRPDERLAALETAIRTVYASSMSDDALVYRKQRGLDQREEPMALLIQRVNGRFHGRYYLPDAAGVGVSRNTFAWDTDMHPEAGMVRLVMGLGTRAVDRIEGDHARVMALDHPMRQPFGNQGETFQFSQQLVDLLDLREGTLATCPLSQMNEQIPELPMPYLAEIDRAASDRAAQLGIPGPIWRLTFGPLVRKTAFIERLSGLLKTLESAYQHPVDVEFTLHFSSSGDPSFNLVQCRPLATLGKTTAVPIPDNLPADRIVFQTQGHFMGGNINLSLDMVIHVDASIYSGLTISQRYDTARRIGEIVRNAGEDRRILLMGPGRWGTSSPELGVPVRFADISGVSALVEIAEMAGDMVPDLSYGSHFFQDLVETGIAYVALFPQSHQCLYQPGQLAVASHARTTDSAIRVYDLGGHPVQMTGDIVSQRLVCFRPDRSTQKACDK